MRRNQSSDDTESVHANIMGLDDHETRNLLAEQSIKKSDNQHLRLLLICGGGIFFSFLFFGIIQEKITKGDYGHGDKFTFIQMLVAFQCVFSIVYAKTVLIYRKY